VTLDAPPGRRDTAKMTTDWRSVYATMIEEWLGSDTRTVLKSRVEPIGVFA